MHNMLKCLSDDLKQSEAYQFIDDVTNDYRELIELVPWTKDDIQTTLPNGIKIDYVCKNDEIRSIYSYQDDWQRTCTICITNYGDKIVIEDVRSQMKQEYPRIIHKISSLYCEPSKNHNSNTSSYYVITTDNTIDEPIEECYVTFDYAKEENKKMKKKR